jgi:hypothetical protein
MIRFVKINEKHLTGKKVLWLFIVTNLVYALMLFVTIPHVMEFSNGMKLLDMLPTGYNVEYVNNLWISLEEQGRWAYLYNQIPIDMIYPGLFALSYCLLLAYFFKKINKLHSPYVYLCWLPIIAGLFDYLENIGIITMLLSYPDYSHNLVKASNIFTVVKSVTTSLYFIALLVVIILLGFRYLRRKEGV